MNRRQVLQSLLGITAGTTCARIATAFGMVPALNVPNGLISVGMLAELLRGTVELCQTIQSEVRQIQAPARANLDQPVCSIGSNLRDCTQPAAAGTRPFSGILAG